MKPAEKWLEKLEHARTVRVMSSTPNLDDIRLIQSDALRWAANLSGVLHRSKVLEVAEALDRIVEGHGTLADRELEQQLMNPKDRTYEELRKELCDLPTTWYPDLLRAMTQAAVRKNVFVQGGISHFLTQVEAEAWAAKPVSPPR